jgi:hypothetical protein
VEDTYEHVCDTRYAIQPLFSIVRAVNADKGGLESIRLVEKYCSELLVHAADVEGLCQGIDEDLVRSKLSQDIPSG